MTSLRLRLPSRLWSGVPGTAAGRGAGLYLPTWLWQGLLLALAYGAAARLGLAYSSLAPNVTLVWAPTGLSLFALLRWGPRPAWGIVLGDLIANAGTGAPLSAILGISLGNLLQTFFGWWALRRVGFDNGLRRVRDVVALLGLGTVGAALSAAIGPTALWLGGTLPADALRDAALQWWMGDATGVVVLTPWLLAWWQRPRRMAPRALGEAALLAAVLLALCVLVFGPAVHAGYYPASLALFPLAVWAALRFGLRGATLLTLAVTVAAVWGTVRGAGPFVDGDLTSSLVRWWVFANVITVTSLLLAAAQGERDAARAQAIRDRDFGEAILDAEGALVVVLNAQGRILRLNRSMQRATGFAPADVVGRLFEDALIPQAQRDKVAGHAELLRLRLSDSARLDSELRCRHGPPITVSWTATALRDPDGRMTHAIVSGVDISARVAAAEALRHARRVLEQRVAERTRDLAQANAALQVQMAGRARLEQELLQAAEQAQQRFGRELHDGLGQHLTATAIQAELLARDLEAAGATEAQHSAERVEALVSDAVAQARRLARGLFPVELDDDGLMAALRTLADSTARQTRRRCTLRAPQPVDLPDHAVAVHLYRIAQEAVANALRHAPGAAVELTLTQLGAMPVLEVRNDLKAGAASDGDGIGLRLMQHRGQLIGATVQAGPDDLGGWRVLVAWPTEEPS